MRGLDPSLRGADHLGAFEERAPQRVDDGGELALMGAGLGFAERGRRGGLGGGGRGGGGKGDGRPASSTRCRPAPTVGSKIPAWRRRRRRACGLRRTKRHLPFRVGDGFRVALDDFVERVEGFVIVDDANDLRGERRRQPARPAGIAARFIIRSCASRMSPWPASLSGLPDIRRAAARIRAAPRTSDCRAAVASRRSTPILQILSSAARLSSSPVGSAKVGRFWPPGCGSIRYLAFQP